MAVDSDAGKGLAVFTAVLLVSVLIGILVYPGCREARRQAIANETAKENERLLHRFGSYRLHGGSESRSDAYGTPMQAGDIATTTESRTVTVRSAGADRQFGSPDDVEFTAVDLNKSRLAGKWLATKSKEAAKGIFDGLRSKPEFQ